MKPLDWLRALQYPCTDCPAHRGLTLADMAVAAALVRWAGVGTCTTRSTVQQIADTARCERKTVMRSTARLRAAGWLIVRSSTTGRHGKGVNLYALVVPEPVDNSVQGRGGRCHRVTGVGVTESPTHAEVGPTEGHAVGTRELRRGQEHMSAAIAAMLDGKAV